MVLDGLTEKDQATEANDPGRIHTPQTILWLINTIVCANIAIAQEIVEPMAPQLCAYGTNYRREEQEGKVAVAEAIAVGKWRRRWQHELGDSADNANCPHSHNHDETGRYDTLAWINSQV